MKIFIVASDYYPKITQNLIDGAHSILKKNNLKIYKVYKIKGTLEIPFVISKLIDKCDAVLALGCIIKGKTKHFDLISSSTTDALVNLSIKNKILIGNGILSCYNIKQAIKRSKLDKNNKGAEAALAVLSVLNVFK